MHYECSLVVSFSIVVVLSPINSATKQQAPTRASVDVAPNLEVATIRPSRLDDLGRQLHPSADRITIENFSLKDLIVYAYNLKDNSQVLSGPDWLDKSHFELPESSVSRRARNCAPCEPTTSGRSGACGCGSHQLRRSL